MAIVEGYPVIVSRSDRHLIYKPETEGLGAMEIDRIWTIPNLITTIRLLCIPLFVYLLLGRDSHGWAAVMLTVLGSTDWVDGYIARRFDQSSTFGAIYDPTVDRALLTVAIVSIIIDGSAPLWFSVTMLVREVVVSAFVVAITVLGAKRMDVTWWGKVSTFLNMGAFPAFLFANESSFSDTTQDVFLVLAYLAAIPGLALALVAAVQYFWRGRTALSEGRAERELATTNEESM